MNTVFALLVQSAQTLSSVTLFDTLVSEFEVCDLYLENKDTKKKNKLQVIERAKQGIGHQINQKVGINEIVLVKVR